MIKFRVSFEFDTTAIKWGEASLIDFHIHDKQDMRQVNHKDKSLFSYHHIEFIRSSLKV